MKIEGLAGKVIAILVLLLASNVLADIGTNSLPKADEVIRYEREKPVFRSTVIAKERGDRLLQILQNSSHFESWGSVVRRDAGTNVIGCYLPVAPHTSVNVKVRNGHDCGISISWDGGLVYLPDDIFIADEAARAELAKLIIDLEYDLKEEVVNTPRPLVYSPGTIEDGGTLSGIARVFYGNASKWRKIYEANRGVIKNPNQIHSLMKLKIPK